MLQPRPDAAWPDEARTVGAFMPGVAEIKNHPAAYGREQEKGGSGDQVMKRLGIRRQPEAHTYRFSLVLALTTIPSRSTNRAEVEFFDDFRGDIETAAE